MGAATQRHRAASARRARRAGRARRPGGLAALAELLGLTIASEIGDISRFASARKLVGYSGLTPKIKQSGQSSRIGRLSRLGQTRCAGPPSSPPSRPGGPTTPGMSSTATSTPPRQGQPRQGRRRPQGPDRPLAHPLPRRAVQAQRTPRHRPCPGKLRHSSSRLRPTNDLRSRDSCNPTTCAP
jgi:hypothetical protein